MAQTIEDRIHQFGASILQEAETRRQMINKLQMSGSYTPDFIAKERKTGIEALQKEVGDWFADLKKELQGKMGQIESKYRQTPVGDPSAQLLAFQRTQARLKAMGKEELEAEALKYIQTGTVASLDELDLLQAELRSRGMDNLADRVRLEAQERYHSYEPWKADPEYQQAEQDLQKANVYGADLNTVYVKAKDGVVEARLISDLLHMNTDDVIGRW
ncbi:MAG: hypothetical protein H5U02_01805 [Clostridia bacterium]|nr:hypothetical protein [Clostridia bacterium]